VRVVVPGHGAPFSDVAAALDRARSRLASFRAGPERHARYAFKVLVKYHLMELGSMSESELMPWAQATPLVAGLLQAQGGMDAALRDGWARALVNELVAQGAAARQGGHAGGRLRPAACATLKHQPRLICNPWRRLGCGRRSTSRRP
jgi:hypothetical protein